MISQVGDHGHLLAVVGKVDVSLIHHHDHILGQLVDQGQQILAGQGGAGGIVGVAEEDQLGLFVDGVEDSLYIQLHGVGAAGDVHDGAVVLINNVVVGGIGGGGDDALVAGLDESLSCKSQGVGGAAGEHDLVGLDAVALGKLLLEESVASGIGVQMAGGKCFRHSGQSFGGHTIGVFVGSQLIYFFQMIFLFGFFDGNADRDDGRGGVLEGVRLGQMLEHKMSPDL